MEWAGASYQGIASAMPLRPNFSANRKITEDEAAIVALKLLHHPNQVRGI
jgi:hypothetical protein